jgi:hypothetical protein
MVAIKKQQHDPDWYLRDPRTRKWMVQCASCKRWGFRKDAPPKFFGRALVEKHLEEMKLDDRGICDQCRGEEDAPGLVET